MTTKLCSWKECACAALISFILLVYVAMSTDYMPPCMHDLHVLCTARSCMNMHLGSGRDVKTGYHLIHTYSVTIIRESCTSQKYLKNGRLCSNFMNTFIGLIMG